MATIKIHQPLDLIDHLPEEEWLIVDTLRAIVRENLPDYCREKISYNVPYFYGKKGICIIWPATIPWGGIKEGVLFGFSQGYLLPDEDNYLDHGTNKRLFYKVFKKIEDIDIVSITKLLAEAVALDSQFQ